MVRRALGSGLTVCSIAALALLAAPEPAAAGKLYKWVDEQGNVQYSDRAPLDPPPQGYEGPKQPTVGEVWEERRKAEEAERELRRRAGIDAAREALGTEEEEGAKGPPQQVKSRYTCEQAKQFVAHYGDPNQRFFLPAEGGGTRRATPEEVANLAREWREAAETLCSENVELVKE